MAGKWERLASRDPEDVCRASGAVWDAGRRVYTVDFLNRALEVDVEARTVDWTPMHRKAGGGPKRNVALLALEYLGCARDVPASGRWVSGRELPDGGAFFFRGPHEAPSRLIAERFGDSPRKFLEKAERLGGVPVSDTAGTGEARDMPVLRQVHDLPGDAAARFRVFPGIDCLVVLWAADDEFPARATILFDSSISEHLQLEPVFLLSLTLALNLM